MTSNRRQNFPARRARQWGTTNTSTTVSAATDAGKVVIDLQAGLEIDLAMNLHNVTASAIRISLTTSFLVGGTLGEAARLSWGIMWATDQAIAAGGAALPNPISDEADWMAHGGITVFVEQIHAHIPRGGLTMISNDSMRKQRENNSTLVLLVQGAVIVHAVGIATVGRTLFLLP